jgi:hypothetical protein
MKRKVEEDLQSWAHHSELSKLRDKAFQKAAENDVSFVFGLRYPGQRFDGWKCEDDTDDEEVGVGGAKSVPVAVEAAM